MPRALKYASVSKRSRCTPVRNARPAGTRSARRPSPPVWPLPSRSHSPPAARSSSVTRTPSAGRPTPVSRTCVVIVRLPSSLVQLSLSVRRPYQLVQPEPGDLALLLHGDPQLRGRVVAEPAAQLAEQLPRAAAAGADQEDVPEAGLVVAVALGEAGQHGGVGGGDAGLLAAGPADSLVRRFGRRGALVDARMGSER